MRRSTATALAALAAAGVAAGAPGVAGGRASAAQRFSAHVDNPWFPLEPGTTWRYRGVKDGKHAIDVVGVPGTVRVIHGVPCIAVKDRLYLDGRLEERTTDWYSQDRHGTVWYFGEATAELDRHGRVTSREGSWLAGRHGAKPGIIMPAHPRVGQSARQEFLRGHAEDHFRVLSLHASVRVPFARFRRTALKTKEWTPLEPAVIDHKFYVRGIGMVAEVTAKGPREENRLVSFSDADASAARRG
jgi:hypothetical protein